MKFFRKFKHTGNKHTAQNATGLVETTPPPTNLKSPTSMYRLGSDENTCVDVELYHTGEVMRIYGFNNSITCMDFTVNLCQLLKLKPSLYCLMVWDPSNRQPWQRASPSSLLSLYLERGAVKSGVTLRLVYKSYVNHILNPKVLNWRPNSVQPSADLITGREMLEQMGARILVYLPGDRKVVVRSRLNQPVAEAVSEVCAQRNLHPTDYILQNPRTGAPLDPSLTFNAQCICEFELKLCSPGCSNLSLLCPSHSPPGISPVVNKRLRSPTGSHLQTQRPYTFCGGFNAQAPSQDPDTSVYSTLNRPLSTISSKSRKKRMAPPPPPPLTEQESVTPGKLISSFAQQQQPTTKRPHTRSAHTIGAADSTVLSSSSSGAPKQRRQSASLLASPYLPRSILFSTSSPEQAVEMPSANLSPNSISYSESFLPQSARAFEPNSNEYPPVHLVSAVSLPVTVIERLDSSSGAGIDEPPPSVAELPETGDSEPKPDKLTVETKTALSVKQDRRSQSPSSPNPVKSDSTEGAPDKEKPSVPPRPSVELLLQHPKYRYVAASSGQTLKPDSGYAGDNADLCSASQVDHNLACSGDSIDQSAGARRSEAK